MSPNAKYIAQLKKAILAQHGCGARHFTTVPVTKTSRGKIIWQGDVEVFDLIKHPKAVTCYAWSRNFGGEVHTTAILGLPPIDSAESAVADTLARKKPK